MRFRLLALSLMLLAAACGGTDAASTTAAATDAPSAAVAPTTAAAQDSAAPDSTEQPGATPTTVAPVTEGPIAPNFVTSLPDGSKFDFGAHDKPVYLVFWAEW